ncbi:MAG TPA: DegT/DnrJ/EryC1/StrS family aminotransferase, partial [Gemmatimonadaceae bacterium]|nr:DegT/DnrJ/EryC1/StrS family aminotransferase [Gemmatimonadaceae bacterium]
VAVPEAIISIGAIPVYVDVEPGGINMDADDLSAKIGNATKAVIVQHSFGLPADVTRIWAVARQYNLPVIEDCAHTIASRVNGQTVGTFGDAAFYSYEAAKPIFAGIGGSAVSNNPRLTQRLEETYTDYRQPPPLSQIETATMYLAFTIAYRPATYWTVRTLYRALSRARLIRGSYNKVAYQQRPAKDFERRMGDMQARQLRQQLHTLDASTAHRRHVADAYRRRIKSGIVTHLPVPPGVDPVFGRYPMFAANKADLAERARAARVELAVFYDSAVQPLKGDDLRAVGYEPGSCPNAEWAADQIVSLPTGIHVGERAIERAVDFLNKVSGQ